MAEALIVAFAALVAANFEELGGRSIAVSEVDPFGDKTNVPTLPIAFTALVGEQASQSSNGGGQIKLQSDILLQFVFTPIKYQREDGAATPFFAFYDYEALRNRLLAAVHGWRTPNNGGLAYKSLDVTSDEFAVYIAFRFTASEVWCDAQTSGALFNINGIASSICAPGTLYCDPTTTPDPCNK